MPYISPDKEEQIRQLAQSGRMIDAIKEYRLITNAGLKEAKDAVEAIMRGSYVNGSAPESADAQSGFSSQQRQILDLMARDEKIEAIKLYRLWTNVGLKEAKDAVEAMARGEAVAIPVPQNTTTSTDDQIRALLAKKQKLEAIKVYRLATNLGLKEAKDYVEAIEAQMTPQPPATSSPMKIPLSNDPFAEENSRTRRMLFTLFVVIALLAGFFFLFLFLRNGF